ncbi:MAG: hypothetical protein DRH26_00120 [Deltaproteobacteria bacterium]|nr:MAG: hypothetical protein DRH26_00120 [Deltaproteobacteria bacterium]
MGDFDLYDVAKGFSYVTDGLSDINKMNNRNTLMKQQEEDRAEKKQFDADVNTNMGTMSGPMNENQQSYAMVGSPTVQAEARRRVAVDTQAKDAIQESKDNDEYKAKANAQIQWMLANPGVDRDNMPPKLSAGFQGKKAQAFLINQEAMSEEGQLRINQSRAAKFKLKFEQFTNSKNHVMTAYDNGDTTTVVSGLQQIVKNLPFPYKLGEFDETTQDFSVKYLDRQSGEFMETGRRVSIPEVIAEIKQTGAEKFFKQSANSAETIRRQNVENRMTPEYAVRKADGQRFIINRQKEPTDPRQVFIEISDEKSGETFIVKSEAEMNKMGIFPENLGREKAMKGMSVQDAQIRRNDRANQPSAAGGAKQQTANRKAYMDTMNMGAKFFNEGGGSMFDEDGNITAAGDNALTNALSFYNDNKADTKALDDTEYQKFMIAGSMLNAAGKFFGGSGGKAPVQKPNPGPEQQTPAISVAEAKVMGAKKLPDGRWVVPSQIKGKAKIVNVDESLRQQPGNSGSANGQGMNEYAAGLPTMGDVAHQGNAMGNGNGWDQTMLGQVEQNVKKLPQNIRDSNRANEEAYQAMNKKRTTGSSIPGMNTFKRTY